MKCVVMMSANNDKDQAKGSSVNSLAAHVITRLRLC